MRACHPRFRSIVTRDPHAERISFGRQPFSEQSLNDKQRSATGSSCLPTADARPRRLYQTVLEVVRYDSGYPRECRTLGLGGNGRLVPQDRGEPGIGSPNRLRPLCSSTAAVLTLQENQVVISEYARRHRLAFRSSPGRLVTRRGDGGRTQRSLPSPCGWWFSAPRIEGTSPDNVANKAPQQG